MSFQVVSERLAALQESNGQLKQLIERLATINFQPGSVPLDDEEGNVMTELTAEIQQMLKDQDEDFELLQEDINDLPGRPGSELAQQREGLDHVAKRSIRELKVCESAFRRAQLSARRKLQDAQREERELLLQSYISEPSSPSSPGAPIPIQQHVRRARHAEPSKEEREVNATSDVTAALRRTHDMMASELSRSQFAHDTLKESTAALAQLSETYSTLDTLLSSSRNLLGTLLRSQKSDTWYLETAFYVLLATIVWLVFRRILYGPMWWLMWFPMKIFFRSLFGILAAIGVTGGSSSVDVASSSIASSSTLIVHNSATGRLSAPSMAGGRAPTVRVGGGGRGAPMPSNAPPQRPDPSQANVSEQVGKIIDESNDGDGTGEERKVDDPAEENQAEDKPNPKKRMWEEEKEAAKEAERKKDEL